jgi:hypothetical protein
MAMKNILRSAAGDWFAQALGIWLTLPALGLLAGCATRQPQTPPVSQAPTAPAAKPAPAPAPASVPAASARPWPDTNWHSLFDGKSLAGWRETDFAGRGPVTVDNGVLTLGMGYMTGVTWTNELPALNYEIELDAMRIDGSDFFCGLTFPVGEDPCSFIVGGWGGGVVGLSSIDGEDAAHNETTEYLNFETKRWYAIRLRVTEGRIQAWIDGQQVVNVDTTNRKLSIRVEVEPSRPLGISSWSTAAGLRRIRMRQL